MIRIRSFDLAHRDERSLQDEPYSEQPDLGGGAFFSDHLRSLHAHKVLDRRLAAVLFKGSAASWIDVFGNKVIWGSAQGFFDRKIKPLRNQL